MATPLARLERTRFFDYIAQNPGKSGSVCHWHAGATGCGNGARCNFVHMKKMEAFLR